MNHAHVSSSTEGYYVISDTFTGKKSDILSGPYASKHEAESFLDRYNDTYHLTTLAGSCQSWADEIEAIKTRVLLPLSLASDADLQARFDFDALDRIVCRMRELTASYQHDLDNRIHGR